MCMAMRNDFLEYSYCIQLFQLTLSEENQKAYKPRPQGNMGSFKTVFINAVQVCDGHATCH